MEDTIRIVAAVVLFGHGMAHAVASPVALGVTQEGMQAPEWMPRWFRIASFPFWLAAAAGLIAGAVGLFADSSWMRVPALAGTSVSTAVLWSWFRGLPVGGKLGALFDLPLLAWLIGWA
jgi:hypothetical protein